VGLHVKVKSLFTSKWGKVYKNILCLRPLSRS
jgi:hypothetical protein